MPEHRRDDVGEEHGRVHAVPPHRLERHLGAELGRVRDLEERVALAQSAVLGQRAAGLAHEPHRRALDLLAPQRADEERVGHGRTLARVDRRAPAHAVPAGPLGVRWLAYELEPPQAGAIGTATVELENAGADAWRDVLLAYHWLDELGNAIDWDGLRTPLARLEPGERAEVEARRPGAHASRPLPARIRPRARGPLLALGDRQRAARRRRRRPPARRRRSGPRTSLRTSSRLRTGTSSSGPRTRRGSPRSAARSRAASASCAPTRRAAAATRPSREPLVCPSLLPPLEPNCEVAGLPAWQPEGDEPWIYDGRIVARLSR